MLCKRAPQRGARCHVYGGNIELYHQRKFARPFELPGDIGGTLQYFAYRWCGPALTVISAGPSWDKIASSVRKRSRLV